ncbi:hypothetical protein PGTUg99_021652 [Puccinia graminis f. sp. tritici]|uniref:Uncharacterized protein n=1 Tax=Puccinia graminis f. sp. tritici TaxID=56615 RepID=A0A5B0Q3N6_PUCGR|nr:hypothetical protein PGTUg99_021652 [Puccinia graminis f. sp. tritici]
MPANHPESDAIGRFAATVDPTRRMSEMEACAGPQKYTVDWCISQLYISRGGNPYSFTSNRLKLGGEQLRLSRFPACSIKGKSDPTVT